MSIESALFTLLTTGHVSLATQVGTRCYPLVLPQNPTLPALVYQELRGLAIARAGGDTGAREERFQVSLWAESFSEIKTGKDSLVDLLSGYSGGTMQRIEIDAMRDDYDTESGWFRQIVEIVIYQVE